MFLNSVLSWVLLDGPLMIGVYAAAAILFVVVCIRRWRRRELIGAVVGAVAGGAIAVAILLWVAHTDAFGVPIPGSARVWIVATFAAVGATVGGMVRARWWRRIIAAFTVVALVAAGTIGVNAVFGLNRTVGDLLGIVPQRPIALPHATGSGSQTASPALPTWASWRMPPGVPLTGSTGTVQIPAVASGFRARAAGLYLPAAASRPDAPRLPLMIMMMGQPGTPTPYYVEQSLDRFAARHHGLAPIVVVADQLGSPSVDPLCLDTAAYGKVETYLTQDVLGWARSHLHVLQDAAHTIVAGYSNGGECALALGAAHPELWSNVLDISGEAYPGSDSPAATLARVFHGDAATYAATRPTAILAQHRYTDMAGVFTVGSNDRGFVAQAKQVNAAAAAAGWATQYHEVPNGGHVALALEGGLDFGFGVLYPRVGLSEPGLTP